MYEVSTESPAGNSPSAASMDSIKVLTAVMSQLSDREVEALEDDLNFFAFTGITSGRIEKVLVNAGMSPTAQVANCNKQARVALAS